MFKKAKTKSALHGAPMSFGKKMVKQKKTLKVAKPVQKKQMTVKTPKQVKTQEGTKPAQKFVTKIVTPVQKKYNDEALMARLRKVTGGKCC